VVAAAYAPSSSSSWSSRLLLRIKNAVEVLLYLVCRSIQITGAVVKKRAKLVGTSFDIFRVFGKIEGFDNIENGHGAPTVEERTALASSRPSIGTCQLYYRTMVNQK
jgi:hypothetical protein